MPLFSHFICTKMNQTIALVAKQLCDVRNTSVMSARAIDIRKTQYHDDGILPLSVDSVAVHVSQ